MQRFSTFWDSRTTFTNFVSRSQTTTENWNAKIGLFVYLYP